MLSRIGALTLIAALLSLPQTSQAQTRDYLFADSGDWTLSLFTGSPYVGLAEAAVGIGQNFTLGFLAGATPKVAAIGIRPRLKVPLSETLSLRLRAPLFYYPKTGADGLGGDPWTLTRPTLVLEKRFSSGLRLHAGGGAILVACVNDLLGRNHDDDHHHQHRDHQHGDHDLPGGDEQEMRGAWNTFNIGGAVPTGQRTDFFFDVSTVMSGLKIAGDDWNAVGGPPLVVAVGLSYRL